MFEGATRLSIFIWKEVLFGCLGLSNGISVKKAFPSYRGRALTGFKGEKHE